ncbi:hypothetical protein SBBP1_510018 [Burkholderiales bacterium]|nr:hypothetical protein SBBP1_510018 [Burkholderiales bacterium]
MPRQIVLASSSRYRQELLARLCLPFATDAPQVDETGLPGEPQAHTAQRLSLLKAQTAARRHSGAVVIGADQVAELDGSSIGKPGSHSAALQQLLAMRGRTVRFHSGIAVVDEASGQCLADCVATDVTFRTLSREALESYLQRDRPYDCAGSAKIESLGICLVESVRSDDPTALVGLPLIMLTSMLATLGIELPPR